MKPPFLHIPLSEKILFAKHLSLMVKTGMPLLDSVRFIRRQVRSSSFRYVLEQVERDVENGKFLSASLGQFHRSFGDLFINVVRVGEASGTLGENLAHLAAELKKARALRQKIRSALIYPTIILVATLGIVSVLVFFVMPRILPIFQSLRIELPPTTRALVFVSTTLLNYGLTALAVLGAVLLLWLLLLRIRGVRFFAHWLILMLPFTRSVSRMANVAESTRTLGLLLKSGVQIVEAVRITAESSRNLLYRRAFLEIMEAVKRGEALYTFLARHEHLFPPTVAHMIEVGETTGSLEENLFYLADFYENEVDETTKNLSVVLEPLLLLLMGGIVGFVAIAIITPIYEVTQSLRK